MNENKTELFKFLSQHAIHLPIDQGKVIYATDGGNVSTTEANALLTKLSPSLHEEADTRLLLHAAGAVKKDHRKFCVCTVETDVVVNAIAMFNQINHEELCWHLALDQIFIISPSMKLLVEWTPGIVLFYQFFTHSLDAIPSCLLVEEEERQLGKTGKFFLMLLKHSNTYF